MSVFKELKRRNVFRVAAAYLVTAWLLIEVSATLEETLRLPEWADSLLAMFLILGFPVALFFSWAYEVTPEGIRKEKDLDSDRVSRPETGRKLDRVIMVMMALALGYFAFDKFGMSQKDSAPNEMIEAPSSEMASIDPADLAGIATPEPSIAVLPFLNMSSDPEQEYFSDGLTEELLNLLAKIPELKVAARTSSFYYKDRMHDIPFKEIGRQLEVAHLLEGSVRKGGDQIRITAQLIKAEDGFHLWSETWDRTLDDVFAIQDEIAAKVAEQMKITLLGEEEPHARVVDTESWELTLQARYFFNRRGEGDLERAFELFQQAIELDPDNSDALAEISPLYVWIFDPPNRDAAYEAVSRALELDPDNAMAHARIANIAWFREGPEAWAFHTIRALELAPRHPTILGIWTGRVAVFGRYDLEIRFYEKALAIDPLHPVNLGNLSNMYNWAGRLDEANQLFDRVDAINPNRDHTLISRAENKLLGGQPQQALELLSQLPPPADPDFTDGIPFMHDLVYLLARDQTGQLEDPAAALAAYVDRFGEHDLMGTAMGQAAMGETDAAIETLQRHYGDSGPIFAQHLQAPYFDSLRDDPRWMALIERIPDMPEEMLSLAEKVLSE